MGGSGERAGNTSSERRPGEHTPGESEPRRDPSGPRRDPTAPPGGVARGGAVTSARQSGSARPVHHQEDVPGRRVPRARPTRSRGRGVSLRWDAPGTAPAAGPGVPALHNRGAGRASLATEQRTGGRRLRSPAPPSPPLPGARPPSPSSWTPARAFPVRAGGAGGTRGVKTQRETKAQRSQVPTTAVRPRMPRFRNCAGPRAVNSRSPTPANPGDKTGG